MKFTAGLLRGAFIKSGLIKKVEMEAKRAKRSKKGKRGRDYQAFCLFCSFLPFLLPLSFLYADYRNGS
jgi:hypothetical protein